MSYNKKKRTYTIENEKRKTLLDEKFLSSIKKI